MIPRLAKHILFLWTLSLAKLYKENLLGAHNGDIAAANLVKIENYRNEKHKEYFLK